ncbi:MAG: 6-pyruvoyl-tetrahydropterin synthase-related protein [Acidobacteriota bacterium]
MAKTLSEKLKVYSSRDRFWLVLIVIACSGVMLPMVVMGVPEGYDILDHLLFASAYHDAILKGSLIVRWGAADNFGFGSVGTRFYPPIADFLTGVINIFTNDWYNSFLVSALFWIFPGSIGIYLWAKEVVSRSQAAFAAILFAVMPYHVFQIYQYAFTSEFAAAAVLPFCFWFITRLIDRGKFIDVLLFAVSVSVLILTHLPTIITGAIGLGVYALILINWKQPGKTLLKLAAAACFVLPATAFYWLRLVSELALVMHSESEAVSGSQAFSYHLFPIYFMARPEFYQLKMLWLLDDNTILTLLILLPGIICLVFKFHRSLADLRQRKVFAALIVTGIVLLFMTMAPSKFIWEHAPMLGKIQFPWRFLSPASIVASISFAIAVPVLYQRAKRLKRPIAYAAILLISAVVIYDAGDLILASAPFTRAAFVQKFGILTDRRACECWLPTGTNEYAFDNTVKVVIGTRSFQIISWEAETRDIEIAAGEPHTMRIATFWYPHWKATINNEATDVGKDENGVLLLNIPSEASHLHLYFQEPAMLSASIYISIVAWLAAIGALSWIYVRRGKL